MIYSGAPFTYTLIVLLSFGNLTAVSALFLSGDNGITVSILSYFLLMMSCTGTSAS